MKSNVLACMDNANMSVRGLAKLTGLSTQTILRARKDETLLGCSLETLQTIARACGCRVKDLFTEEDNHEDD